ncbi:MAG: D-alanyl-D-alanine carboxypeptidase [Oscillospiraceae bacterium]|nr:D-alanyl-D-alanine carboxypeptidase [Oscillospiraceae bacterium]
MKKIKIFPLFFALCLLLGLFPVLSPPVRAEDPPLLNSTSAILVERQTGRILYAKYPDARLYPASLTKIMTVLLAVEAVEKGEVSMDGQVTASPNITFDLSSMGSTAGIQVGETMPLRELLYCAMLSSANEACNIIAEHVAGSISAFVERMNARASDLGCVSTQFVNTHGLTSYEHYTTARDMARIAMEASRHAGFMDLCGTADHTVPATNLSAERSLHSSNALISELGLYGPGHLYYGASGMKTGHTSYAGYCLASTAERSGTELLCLCFGCETSEGVFQDSTNLLNWGFAAYSAEAFAGAENLSDVTVPPESAAGSIPDTAGPDIGSGTAVVINREDGQILYSRSGGSRVYPADTVKLMTALLAAEAVERGEASLASDVAVSAGVGYDLTASATRMLGEGETLTLEQLLYLALLSSADDACNAIAEYLMGSEAEFISQMNARALSLGCTGTRFTNTHGLFDLGSYTTAADMCLIAQEVCRHDLLTRICSAPSTELPETNLSPARTLVNTNAMLTEASPYGAGYLYERASGLKTGYNATAGYCLVSAASDPDTGISLICAVFGGEAGGTGITSFSDTVKLCDYVFSNFSYQDILRPDVNIASVDVNLGKDVDYVNLRPAEAVTLLLPNDYDPGDYYPELLVYSLQQGQIVTAPVTAGEVLGEISVIRRADGRACGTVKLVAASSVDLSRGQYIRTHVSETMHTRTFRLVFWGVVLLLLLYIGWVIAYRVRRLHQRRAARLLAAQQAAAAAAPVRRQDTGSLGRRTETPDPPEAAPPQPPAAPARGEVALERFSSDQIPPPAPVLSPDGNGPVEVIPFREEEQQPAEKASPAALPDPFADIDLSLFDGKDDKDYFADFFRNKP